MQVVVIGLVMFLITLFWAYFSLAVYCETCRRKRRISRRTGSIAFDITNHPDVFEKDMFASTYQRVELVGGPGDGSVIALYPDVHRLFYQMETGGIAIYSSQRQDREYVYSTRFVFSGYSEKEMV